MMNYKSIAYAVVLREEPVLPLGKKKVLNLQKDHFGHKLKCLKILQLDFFFSLVLGRLFFFLYQC